MPKRYRVDEEGAVYTFTTDGKGKFIYFSNDTDTKEKSNSLPSHRYRSHENPRHSQPNRGLRMCPFCQEYVRRSEFREHLRLRHPTQTNRRRSEEPEVPTERTLRRVGEAPEPRAEDVPIGMARCDLCHALVPRTRIDEHMEKKHAKSEETELIDCPECEAEVRSDRLEKHLRKVHGQNGHNGNNH